MKSIPLSQRNKKTIHKGLFAKVDDEDYDFLMQRKWMAHAATGKPHLIYAQRKGDGNKTISMHRVIMKVSDPKVFIDHKDRDTLNNQKANLRTCDAAQNAANRRSCIGSTSSYRGVDRKGKKWKAQIKKGGTHYYLGLHDNERDAARAYNEKAKELHGEFAYLNIIE